VFRLPGTRDDDSLSYFMELANFLLLEKSTEKFLYAVEFSFKIVDQVARKDSYLARPNAFQIADNAVEELNARFREHGVGFQFVHGQIIRIDSKLIHGHSLKEDRVRTLVLLAVIGDSGKEILKDLGINIGRRVAAAAIDRIPGRVLVEINERVGFRLLTKAGERGLVNFAKIVPVVGGVVGGSFDATMCVGVGKTAKRIFRTEKQSDA
jgi:hypothetical protein